MQKLKTGGTTVRSQRTSPLDNGDKIMNSTRKKKTEIQVFHDEEIGLRAKNILQKPIPYCRCSPLFTDEMLQKIKKDKLIGLDIDLQLLNRADFQKEFYDAKTLEKKVSIYKKISKQIFVYRHSFEDLILATDKYCDILIVKKNNKNLGFMVVSLIPHESTYSIDNIYYTDDKIGSLMMMVYLLCLRELKFSRGKIYVADKNRDSEIYCLADKYGFSESNPNTPTNNFNGFMDVSLLNRKDNHIVKAKFVNTYLEKGRVFRRTAKNCKQSSVTLKSKKTDVSEETNAPNNSHKEIASMATMSIMDELIESRRRDLTKDELEKYTHAVNMDNNDIVTEKFNIVITGETMRRLQEKQWLNDEIINFYMKLLQERDKELCKNFADRSPSYFFSSHFMDLLKTRDEYNFQKVRRWAKDVPMSEQRRIYFPININNQHWALAVVHMDIKEIRYYDSIFGENKGNPYMESLLRWLKDVGIKTSDWKCVGVRDIPQQNNGSDCGMFTILFCDFLSDDLPMAFSQKEINHYRKKTVIKLLNGRLDYPLENHVVRDDDLI
jgi:sentrin-specific protease 1